MNDETLPDIGYAMPEQAYEQLDLLESLLLTLTALVTPHSHDEPADISLPRTATTVCLVELSQLATRLKDSLQWYSLVKPAAA